LLSGVRLVAAAADDQNERKPAATPTPTKHRAVETSTCAS